MEKTEQKDLFKKWSDRIKKSEKEYKNYFETIKSTRSFYKNGNKNGSDSISQNAFNIFWSGIETQKPFLYFKRPNPYLERVNKASSIVDTVACKIIEKALEWDLSQFDFDSVAKYARNDYLISGCGILWERYNPTFKTIAQSVSVDNSEPKKIEVKDKEVVLSEYLDPLNFIADVEKVGVWEECTWIARKIHMTKKEAISSFGKKVESIIRDFTVKEKEEDYKKEIIIYEIWDKTTKRVYWLCLDLKDEFLKIEDDPLKLTGFFPCPKPIFATLTNDSLIPVPDFSMIKQMLDELNGVTERMRLTMQALKVSGVYDSSFSKMGDIFSKDVTLVSLTDFDRLKAAGGIRGVIDFVPIEQYITALEALAKRRDDLTQNIFDITGVSDIMRGNSDPSETATAVTKKTNFGTLRNQDRQNDMQRFICDLYKIKAEIICEMFEADKLASFISPEDGYDTGIIMKAVALLKEEKMRDMIMNIETEEVFNQEQEAQKTLEGTQTISKMITEAMPIVSSQPLLLPLYKQMIESVAATLPRARQFEAALEKVFASVSEQLSQPQEQQTPTPDPKVEAQMANVQKDFEIDKEKNALKARELDIKENSERTKLELINKEMDLQAVLKKKEIENKDPHANANITTGYVGGF